MAHHKFWIAIDVLIILLALVFGFILLFHVDPVWEIFSTTTYASIIGFIFVLLAVIFAFMLKNSYQKSLA